MSVWRGKDMEGGRGFLMLLCQALETYNQREYSCSTFTQTTEKESMIWLYVLRSMGQLVNLRDMLTCPKGFTKQLKQIKINKIENNENFTYMLEVSQICDLLKLRLIKENQIP